MIHAPPAAALMLLDHEIDPHLRVIMTVSVAEDVSGKGLPTTARPLFFLVWLFVR